MQTSHTHIQWCHPPTHAPSATKYSQANEFCSSCYISSNTSLWVCQALCIIHCHCSKEKHLTCKRSTCADTVRQTVHTDKDLGKTDGDRLTRGKHSFSKREKKPDRRLIPVWRSVSVFDCLPEVLTCFIWTPGKEFHLCGILEELICLFHSCDLVKGKTEAITHILPHDPVHVLLTPHRPGVPNRKIAKGMHVRSWAIKIFNQTFIRLLYFFLLYFLKAWSTVHNQILLRFCTNWKLFP